MSREPGRPSSTTVEEQTGVLIKVEQLDLMIDQVIEVAKARNGRHNEAAEQPPEARSFLEGEHIP